MTLTQGQLFGATTTVDLRLAAPGECGTHFIKSDDPDHRCRPACYRIGRSGIYLLCDHGHSAGFCSRRDGTFGGSAFEALLGTLPAFAPFVVVK